MTMRILHVLDHSIPLHSGYTFRTLALLREQRKLTEAEQVLAEAPLPNGDHPILLRARASWRLRDGRFAEAAADLAKLVELSPESDWNWMYWQIMLAATGNEAQYRTNCQAMLARFGSTKDPGVAERVSKSCLLLPAAGAELEAAGRLQRARSDDSACVSKCCVYGRLEPFGLQAQDGTRHCRENLFCRAAHEDSPETGRISAAHHDEAYAMPAGQLRYDCGGLASHEMSSMSHVVQARSMQEFLEPLLLPLPVGIHVLHDLLRWHPHSPGSQQGRTIRLPSVDKMELDIAARRHRERRVHDGRVQ